jgi:thiol-disulfide isomerase/thioredoxin
MNRRYIYIFSIVFVVYLSCNLNEASHKIKINKATTDTLVKMNVDSVQFMIGKKPPQWELKILDDKILHLSELDKKFILIEFWGVGCGACVIADKALHELDSIYKSKDLKILGIVVPDQYDTFYKDWMKKYCQGIPFYDTSSCFEKYVKWYKEKYYIKQSITLIDNGIVSIDYRVKAYPTFFLINKEGIVVYAQTGFSENIKNEIINYIETK